MVLVKSSCRGHSQVVSCLESGNLAIYVNHEAGKDVAPLLPHLLQPLTLEGVKCAALFSKASNLNIYVGNEAGEDVAPLLPHLLQLLTLEGVKCAALFWKAANQMYVNIERQW